MTRTIVLTPVQLKIMRIALKLLYHALKVTTECDVGTINELVALGKELNSTTK